MDVLDAVTIAERASSATSGWRAICVRERRRLGAACVEPLTTLDLDLDVGAIAPRVEEVAARALPDVDTLVFGLFDPVDDGSIGSAGFHVSGAASRGRPLGELMRDPWTPSRVHLPCRALDAIVEASEALPRSARPGLTRGLQFGAALLMSRFAARELPHRIVLAWDEPDEVPALISGRFPRHAEIASAATVAARAPWEWPGAQPARPLLF